jgi:hypothetical protein
MRLYGIDDNFGRGIKLQSVEVKRETKKLYILDSQFVNWLGYVSQIQKNDRRVFLTETDAIDNYISEKQYRIKKLQTEIEQEERLLSEATELKTKL